MDDITSVVETTLSNRTISRMHGVEYSGACPWCGGTDRFHVWPDENPIPGIGSLGLFQCMGESAGRSGCGRKGDMVKYLQERRGLSFSDACNILHIDIKILLAYRNVSNGHTEHTTPTRPIELAKADTSKIWQERADSIVTLAQRYLYSEHGTPGLAYLHSRGLTDEIIKSAELGYCQKYVFDDATKWGFQEGKSLLARGIVIPWRDVSGRVVCIRFRRLPEDTSEDAKKCYGIDGKTSMINRYRVVFGSSTQHLYQEGTAKPGRDAVLLEGELDALAATQSLDSLTAVVATGSTSWGRNSSSIERLSRCIQVLVCYDADKAGDKASKYWLTSVSNARRWRPLYSDANDMLNGGVDIATWIKVGLETKPEVNQEDEIVETDVAALRQEITDLLRQEDESYVYSINELDSHWPPSARVHKRIGKIAI